MRHICTLWREYRFAAAHKLTGVPHDHKCAAMHGHNYRVTVYVEGDTDDVSGMVVDYAEIDRWAGRAVRSLDHMNLNQHLDNPTAERLARWLWDRIVPRLPQLAAIDVCENDHSGCTYKGPSH